jgi:hypothetical protein
MNILFKYSTMPRMSLIEEEEEEEENFSATTTLRCMK